MTLEDFEKSLEKPREHKSSHRKRSRSRDRERRHRHHHSSHHRDSRRKDDDHESSRHRHKRSRHSDDEPPKETSHKSKRREEPVVQDVEDDWIEKEPAPPPGDEELDDMLEHVADADMQRSAWMQTPSSMDVEYKVQKKKEDKSKFKRSAEDEYKAKLHEKKTRHQLEDLNDSDKPEAPLEPEKRAITYTFGDTGSSWRMTKLKNVYRQAKETGRSVDEVALDRFGDMRDFDDAREEENELDRRKMYGEGYSGKDKPTGELYEERVKLSKEKALNTAQEEQHAYDISARVEQVPDEEHAALDQTALNKLKAQMMKAKLRKDPNAAKLEEQYNKAAAAASKKPSDVVVLNAMENRLLAGGRRGEVTTIDNKRGRERRTVEENHDMTIEDMVRQERRTKGRGEGSALAERIAKDGKFTDDLDYLDENAEKLAKHVMRSDINLRNMAIGDFQKLSRILDACPLCHHEDKGTGPTAPVIALGTRAYLTLPTEPELSEGGAVIVPSAHHDNLLDCDEDEWEEIRNFMKCLIRMYHEQGREVIFYENAAAPHRKPHAAMVAVPLPYALGETAPAFFREAMLSSDEEWSQHKKVIDTLAKAKGGLGRAAFRKTLVKEMPYFHVWFELDGGLGHVVEDAERWPRGDLFAREIIGGMLDVDAATIKRQGRWQRHDKRADGFKKRFKKFDWTRVLSEA
ncbi:hypothetical protein BT63DRAFT_290444 [Microthyrium microscopicum]|uniref:Cell cycle control protein cwf19 n=1 Tax=Microthyrium microscopicum TaxID=703497 RepID=A0A6A6U6S0_9PEZI|nr:hypothetical protein BT63DRAFT_290444 [Microthyrium microscopicum]